MAIAANQIRVQQYGGATVGEQRQIVYDTETGIAGQKITTVAEVPTSDGGTAFLYREQVQVGQIGPPSHTSHQRAIGHEPHIYNVNNADVQEKQSRGPLVPCAWFTCGCFVFLVGLAMIIAIAVVHLLDCTPLHSAAISGIVLAVIVILISFVCCLRCLKIESFLTHCLCCSTISLLSLVFLVALIPNTVYVAENIDFIRATNTSGYNCDTPVVSLAVMGISYAMLPLFGLFCLWSFCLCFCSFGVKNDGE